MIFLWQFQNFGDKFIAINTSYSGRDKQNSVINYTFHQWKIKKRQIRFTSAANSDSIVITCTHEIKELNTIEKIYNYARNHELGNLKLKAYN